MAEKTVLIIEDSLTQALHMQTLLEREGLNVVLASDGTSGVQLAHRMIPDLILVDMQLPEMNGLEVCSQIKRRRETYRIPIIMLTRHDDPELVTLGLQLGLGEYIPKDAFADAVLLETLRQVGLIPVSHPAS